MKVQDLRESPDHVPLLVSVDPQMVKTPRKPKYFRQSSSILFQNDKKPALKKQTSASLFPSKFDSGNHKQNVLKVKTNLNDSIDAIKAAQKVSRLKKDFDQSEAD